MIPYVGNRSDAIALLRETLEEAKRGITILGHYLECPCYVKKYECTLVESLEVILDALERGIA